VWVFGYGSLMWNPGFRPAETRLAVLPGFARRFCMWSVHHRGTPEEPGLVLALDRAEGAACTGLAFRVRHEEEEPVLAALRERELISSAYLEERHDVALEDGRVEAVTFVVDRSHVQYCGGLSLEEQARVIARARGGRGPNDAYLHATVAHLAELGIDEPDLAWLDRRVRAAKCL
jgi:cation transport protein ChaC